MKNTFVLILLILLFEGCDLGKEEIYVVKVEADIGVTVSPLNATVHQGETVTFTYTLKEGYELDRIVMNGVTIIPFANSFSVTPTSPEMTVKVTTKEKQKFIISAIAKENGTISPMGDVTVVEGQDQAFSITPNIGFLVESLKIDGQAITSSASSYTFSKVTSNSEIEATFKKDSILWPLLYIEWNLDSIYIDNNKSPEAGEEILNFYSGGRYTVLWNNKLYDLTGWSVDKGKNPAILTYDGRSCKIEEINEEKLIFSYINEINQKVTHVYSARSKQK